MKIEFVQEIIDIIRGKKTLTEKPTIPFLVFWVGTKCTLRCQDCCNWIPYIEQKSYDAKEIIKDIIYLSKKTNIKRVQLQGGEIFTHPKADLIIDRIAKKVKAEEISITTNATLKLKHNIIDVLKKHPKIGLTVSNYDCAKDQRTNFIKQLNDNNISYHLYDFCNNDNTWFKTGSPLTPKCSEEQAIHNYDICIEKNCLTLADGLLYSCGKILAINEFHKGIGVEGNSFYNIRAERKKERKKERKLAEFFMLITSLQTRMRLLLHN